MSVGVGGTSYLGRTGQTEPRYMPPDGSPIPMTEFRLGERYGERERIAEQYGVPLENVRPAASPTGATAWTVTPAAKPTTGRHAAAEIKVDTERALTDIRETRYRVEDLFRANNARWAHGTYTMHRGTRTPIFMAECECGEQFDNPSQDGAKAQWDTHRREAFEAALLDIDDHVNTEGDE